MDRSDPPTTTHPRSAVRALLGVRQIRQFTDEPVTDEQLDALTEVARWSGSSRNEQPWWFVVIRDPATIRAIAEAGMPQTRSLHTATAAIAIVLPDEPAREVSRAYDEGRVAERILIGASFLDLGAGIAWIRKDIAPLVRELLHVPSDRVVRTVMSLGRPSLEARRHRLPPGAARRPREELVFEGRWPAAPASEE